MHTLPPVRFAPASEYRPNSPRPFPAPAPTRFLPEVCSTNHHDSSWPRCCPATGPALAARDPRPSRSASAPAVTVGLTAETSHRDALFACRFLRRCVVGSEHSAMILEAACVHRHALASAVWGFATAVAFSEAQRRGLSSVIYLGPESRHGWRSYRLRQCGRRHGLSGGCRGGQHYGY